MSSQKRLKKHDLEQENLNLMKEKAWTTAQTKRMKTELEKKEKELQETKNKLQEVQKTLEAQKQKTKKIQAERDTATNKAKKTEEDLLEAKKNNVQTTETTEKETANLKATIRELKREKDDTKTGEMKQEEKEVLDKIREEHRVNIQEKEDLQHKNKALRARLTQANSTINNMLKEQNDSKTEEKTQQTKNTEPRTTVLGDSNTRGIVEYLDKEAGMRIDQTPVYTTSQLLDRAESTSTAITEADHIIIHVGTNDIRRGMKANEIFRDLEAAAHTIRSKSEAVITIVAPPPIQTKYNHELERLKLQQKIMNETDYTPLAVHDECDLQEDNYHIDRHSARNAAKDIKHHIHQTDHTTKQTNNQQTKRTSRDMTTTHQIPQDMMPHIVGKEAKNVKRMTAKHNVRIHYLEDGTIEITGKEQNTTKTIEDIETTIQKVLDNREYYKDKRQKNTTPPKTTGHQRSRSPMRGSRQQRTRTPASKDRNQATNNYTARNQTKRDRKPTREYDNNKWSNDRNQPRPNWHRSRSLH